MMLHKFRRAMINLKREPLQGEVEVDDTWVGGEQAGTNYGHRFGMMFPRMLFSQFDSQVVGVAKPDPAIFDFAVPVLGKAPSDVIYVGDSVKYDVRSAEAAGMTPLHFDPFGLCQAIDHAHVASVGEALQHV